MVSPTRRTNASPSQETGFNSIADDIAILTDLRDTYIERHGHDFNVDIYNDEIDNLRGTIRRVSDNYNFFRQPENMRFLEANPDIIRIITEDPNIISNADVMNRINELKEEYNDPPSMPSSRDISWDTPEKDINALGNKKNKTKTNKHKSKKCCPKKCCSKRCHTKKCRSKKCCSKKIHNKRCHTKKCRYRKCCVKKSRK